MAETTPAKKSAPTKKTPAKKSPAKKAAAATSPAGDGAPQVIRRVAVVGGNRIPFARSNTVYTGVSNQEMLTAALDGLVDRFGLEGERAGEVVAGPHLGHAEDREHLQAGRHAAHGLPLMRVTPARRGPRRRSWPGRA